ncbi:MAG: cytochrome c-type biogenesis CcmF C-terminal domain-containing protein [Phycisphaerales bacterium]
MSPWIGSAALGLALAGAAGSVGACAAAAARGGVRPLGAARAGFTVCALGLVSAAAVLLIGLARDDFRLAYIAAHSERGLAWPLRLAAFWAGQEGSLLLWATMLALVGGAVVWGRRTGPAPEAARSAARSEAAVIAVFAVLGGFFAALMLAGADPFRVLAEPAAEGRGLHPQLQYWAMVVHPPLLMLGYAASGAPFALAIGALARGDGDAAWLRPARRWALGAWLSLGAGIVLGMRWAYVEQGWGGYWAWDPVENAALLPWLTGTALLHSMAVHQHRGVLKGWTVALAGATFLLSLVGAWVTRAGSVASVHSFARPELGAWFLGLMAALGAGAGALAWHRRALLTAERRAGGMLSREGAVLAGNILLVMAAASVGAGTLLPLVAGAEGRVGVGVPFYIRTVAPIGLGIVALLALSPLLAYGATALRGLGRAAAVPVAAGVGAAGAALLLGLRHPAGLACVLALVVGVAAVGTDLVTTVRGFARATGFGAIGSLLRVVDSNHRRYGGQLAHLGLLLMMAGVVGSSVFAAETAGTVRRGESVSVGGQAARFDGVKRARGENYTAARAAFTLADGASLAAERRYYDRTPDQPVSEVGLRSTWRGDLMLVLLDWTEGGEVATVQVRAIPMMAWVWTGAAVIGAGGVVCLRPGPRRGGGAQGGGGGARRGGAGRRRTAARAAGTGGGP